MKIRAVTLFTCVGATPTIDTLGQAARQLERLSAVMSGAGFEVQTTRLVTQPFPAELGGLHPEQAPGWAQALENACSELGINYVSVGPAGLLPGAPDEYQPQVWAEQIPEMLAGTRTLFITYSISDPASPAGVNSAAAAQAAGLIQRIARQTDDGFNNLRFAAVSNCPPLIPFFPVAYHDGGANRWGIAVQAADLVLDAFSSERTVPEKLQELQAALEAADRMLSSAAQRVSDELDVPYLGCDWSPAPFPDAATSIGGALERLSGRFIGTSGTLWAAACLTETLRKADIQRTGYTGLMLPVLEDSVLARRGGDGTVSVNDMLLYSAVCGLGLDTVPLPGDASAEALTGVLLDMGALAMRLNKPLTARLLLVPGKRAGDPVEYGFEYFAPGKVMQV